MVSTAKERAALRIECLRCAIERRTGGSTVADILAAADRFFQWITEGDGRSKEETTDG